MNERAKITASHLARQAIVYSDARRLTSSAASSAFRLLSRVGGGDIPALRCG